MDCLFKSKVEAHPLDLLRNAYNIYTPQVSEEEGFEPPVPLLVLLFSKQMHSATLPLFLKNA